METNYIALAIPAFFLSIGGELWLSRRRGLSLYRLSDAVSNISTGVIEQLALLLCAAFMLTGYVAVYTHFRVFEMSGSGASTWLLCFVAMDFAYYWFHRLSHEVNFMWAAHVVHHQSEDYNLAVALRQSTLQPFMSMVFYWPLALVGFPPLVFAACASFNTLYQFWIHTRTIDRLGPLEWVLMTPSHHRVHHGRNPIYIDRNHGGTFIVWDMLFGTHQREQEEVAYGVTKPLASWNPIWANFQYWQELWQAAGRTRRLRDKLLVYLKPPGWLPDDLGGFQPAPPITGAMLTYDPAFEPRIGRYVLLQFVQVLTFTALLLLGSKTFDLPRLALGTAAIAWGLANLGALLEGRAWAARSELVRLVAMPIASLPLLAGGSSLVIPALLALNGVPAWLAGLRWQPGLAGPSMRATLHDAGGAAPPRSRA